MTPFQPHLVSQPKERAIGKLGTYIIKAMKLPGYLWKLWLFMAIYYANTMKLPGYH